MKSYPYTIDNGHGEQLTFTGVTHGPDGDRAEVDGVAQPGAGPPMHVHYLQEEAARVVTGRLGYQVLGEDAKFAGPGELVVWPAGTPHKWWNAGDDRTAHDWVVQAARQHRVLPRRAFRVDEGERRRPPSAVRCRFLMTRYRSEFAMLELPAFVRRVVIPVLYVVGRMLGKYEKYSDAPEPIAS